MEGVLLTERTRQAIQILKDLHQTKFSHHFDISTEETISDPENVPPRRTMRECVSDEAVPMVVDHTRTHNMSYDSSSSKGSRTNRAKRRTELKQYKCTKCGRSFGWKYSLTRHNCKPKKTSICAHCGKDFKYPCYLKKHKCQTLVHNQYHNIFRNYPNGSPTNVSQSETQNSESQIRVSEVGTQGKPQPQAVTVCFEGGKLKMPRARKAETSMESCFKLQMDLSSPSTHKTPQEGQSLGAKRQKMSPRGEEEEGAAGSSPVSPTTSRTNSRNSNSSSSSSSGEDFDAMNCPQIVLRPFSGGILVNSIPPQNLSDQSIVFSTAHVMGGSQFWIKSSPSLQYKKSPQKTASADVCEVDSTS